MSNLARIEEENLSREVGYPLLKENMKKLYIPLALGGGNHFIEIQKVPMGIFG